MKKEPFDNFFSVTSYVKKAKRKILFRFFVFFFNSFNLFIYITRGMYYFFISCVRFLSKSGTIEIFIKIFLHGSSRAYKKNDNDLSSNRWTHCYYCCYCYQGREVGDLGCFDCKMWRVIYGRSNVKSGLTWRIRKRGTTPRRGLHARPPPRGTADCGRRASRRLVQTNSAYPPTSVLPIAGEDPSAQVARRFIVVGTMSEQRSRITGGRGSRGDWCRGLETRQHSQKCCTGIQSSRKFFFLILSQSRANLSVTKVLFFLIVFIHLILLTIFI